MLTFRELRRCVGLTGWHAGCVSGPWHFFIPILVRWFGIAVYLSSSDRCPPLITVRGEVDLATADTLVVRLSMLAAPAAGQIALDLAQVTFLDCAGLRALIAFEQYVWASGGSVRVAAVSSEVARLFELVGRCGVSLLGFVAPVDSGRRRAVTPVLGARDAASSSSARGGTSTSWPIAHNGADKSGAVPAGSEGLLLTVGFDRG